MRRGIFVIFLWSWALLAHANATSSVEAAGTTQTSVSFDAGTNTSTVHTASPDSRGNSLNEYKRFGSAAGETVLLEHNNARTIINSVIFPNISEFAGTLKVLGQPANVIVVNPWGIVVNGGQFRNTGSLVLTTAGTPSAPSSGIDPNAIDDNGNAVTALLTSQGMIHIGQAGLAGEFYGLELIAKNILEEGAITNDRVNAESTTRLVAGSTRSEIRSNAPTNQAIKPSVTHLSLQESSPGEILVDLSPLASVRDAHIEMLVNDIGAGVRVKGALLAEGDVEIISAGDVDLSEALLMAGRDIQINSLGAVLATAGTVTTAGRENFTNAVGGALLDNATFSAGENIGVITNNALQIQNDSLLAAGGNLAFVASDLGVFDSFLSAGGGGALQAQNGWKLTRSQLVAGRDWLLQSANADVDIRASAIQAEGDVLISAENGTLYTRLFRTSVPNQEVLEEYTRKERSFLFFSKKTQGFRINFGEESDPGAHAAIVSGGNTVMHAKQIINAGGDIISGGTLQMLASEYLYNTPTTVGSAAFEITCGFFCTRTGHSSVRHLGGNITSDGVMEIAVGKTETTNGITHTTLGTLQNDGGMIVSNSDINIVAGEVINNAREEFEFNNPFLGMRGNYGFMNRFDRGGIFQSYSGRLSINTLVPVIVRGGELRSFTPYDIPMGVITERERIIESPHYPVRLGALWSFF